MTGNCIFCKIIKGEIPSAKVYESESCIAFLDINPINKGHTLIVPKEHYENFEDIPDNVLSDLIIVAKKIVPEVIEAVGADAYNLGLNNGPKAGQVVPHAHLHIMTRFEGDGLRLWPGSKYAEGEMEKVKENIVKAIKRSKN